MKKHVAIVACLIAVAATEARAQNVQVLTPLPLEQVVKTQPKPVVSGVLQLPLIAWGADEAAILADQQGLFREEGLQVSLFAEDDFAKQVQGVMDGKSPLLRGTLGQINSAAAAFRAAGLDLVVIDQLSWSVGGDTMVVRGGIHSPSDLRGKTIAVQLYGPHMDYVMNILTSAGIKPDEVKLKWFKELTLPKYDTKGQIVDPVSAFTADSTIDGVMCISPDANTLSSGGKVGTGAEGSVKGAHVLLTTRTASRVIPDVYAVRSDWFENNRATVQKLEHALLRSREALQDLFANKASQQTKYQQLLAKSADLLLGAPQATADAEGLYGDMELVSHAGNVAFFNAVGTTRNFKVMTDEIQTAFNGMGLMNGRVVLKSANWDYQALASGLKNVDLASLSVTHFDTKKVAASVESKIKTGAEASSWEGEGTLFKIEINFAPNESSFPEERYGADYEKALQITQTYGGAVVVIEGHGDPKKINDARAQGVSAPEVSQMEQAVKNLSLQRAMAVRTSYLAYCKTKSVTVDESQLVPVGMGIKTPKFPVPHTKQEWDANRRVVFLIKNVEAEATEFAPTPSK